MPVPLQLAAGPLSREPSPQPCGVPTRRIAADLLVLPAVRSHAGQDRGSMTVRMRYLSSPERRLDGCCDRQAAAGDPAAGPARFSCGNPDCPGKTFAEQTQQSARTTVRDRSTTAPYAGSPIIFCLLLGDVGRWRARMSRFCAGAACYATLAMSVMRHLWACPPRYCPPVIWPPSMPGNSVMSSSTFAHNPVLAARSGSGPAVVADGGWAAGPPGASPRACCPARPGRQMPPSGVS
jgi:hypothetical protein